MRKSGGAASTAAVQAEPVPNPGDLEMDEDLDPASMYEDEEGQFLCFKPFIHAHIYGQTSYSVIFDKQNGNKM